MSDWTWEYVPDAEYRAELPGLAGVRTGRGEVLFLQHLPE
jgi:hypothetical protein